MKLYLMYSASGKISNISTSIPKKKIKGQQIIELNEDTIDEIKEKTDTERLVERLEYLENKAKYKYVETIPWGYIFDMLDVDEQKEVFKLYERIYGDTYPIKMNKKSTVNIKRKLKLFSKTIIPNWYTGEDLIDCIGVEITEKQFELFSKYVSNSGIDNDISIKIRELWDDFRKKS